MTYRASVPSPDGHWTALVESKQWSGPGTNYDATEVLLRQADRQAFQVLGFSHQYGTMRVQLSWRDAKHLKVRYGPSEHACDHVDVNFQAVQAAGIEIALEALPGNANQLQC